MEDSLAEPYCVIKKDEFEQASGVTRSCRLQSREFQGETPEWTSEWVSGNDPNAKACGSTDCNILVHRMDNKLVGIVCVAIYGHESEKGAIVWIREIAVRPEFQGQGIGRKLLLQGLKYGIEHGAKRAFLAADEYNHNAIKLYQSVGFVPKDGPQIDMIYV
jgi:ribosomal protein S18 acetylase RimI-like enzyme